MVEKKLQALGIQYEKKTDIEEMKALGLKTAPVLRVNGKLLEYHKTLEWLREAGKSE